MLFRFGFFLLVLCFSFSIQAEPANPSKKIKFYNFDDLLIDGKITKPKLLWIDTRQKVKFERLLRLKKDFLPKLESTKKDPTLK